MSRAFCCPMPGRVFRKTWSPASIARAMRPIGAENARAAAFGPDPGDRDQRLEKLALDRVGETEENVASGVSVDLQLRIHFERER